MGKERDEVRFCVIIPAYNESRVIGDLVSEIKTAGHDVVVIDDGSSDNTGSIARDRGAHVLGRSENRGKGASLKEGFEYAVTKGYDAVIVMDGDGQHDPKEIGRFLSAARATDADIIVGNRMGDADSMPWIRKFTNRTLSRFISSVCGQDIPDTQCGYRLIKSRCLREISLVSSKYETESEILMRACKARRFKIDSIPIKSIYGQETSTIHPVKDALRFIRLVITMKLERLFKKK